MRGTRRVGLKKNIGSKATPPKNKHVTPPRSASKCTPLCSCTPSNTLGHTPTGKRLTLAPVDSPNMSEGEGNSMGLVGSDSPMTSRKWTFERERVLCEMWEEETHLYDSTSHDYRNSHKRQRAFLRMSAGLKLEGN